MSKVRFRLDSTPRKVGRLPFASESELQQFVEDHSTELLGVKVIASARKGGNRYPRLTFLRYTRQEGRGLSSASSTWSDTGRSISSNAIGGLFKPGRATSRY